MWRSSLSPLALLAVVTTACGDSFSLSGVAGIYERVDAPTILTTSFLATTQENGEPAFEVRTWWMDWQHFTLTAASNWTLLASYTTVVKVFDLGGMLVDSFDIPQSTPGISGSFTLSPPDSIFFSDGSQTFGGTIVPPNLFLGTTYTRR